MRKKTTGFTLIEMLVGIVIGMIVVAAASVMMVSVLKSQKDITASARLNQELGAAMAVMSNEIRRAGFSVCLESNAASGCEDFDLYELGDDINVVGGNCIEYRYNAGVDDDSYNSSERRGFRLNGDFIEMAGSAGDVSCGSNNNWVPLTDPAVMKVSAIPGFTFFSTVGSKCRNMTKKIYWEVGVGATGLACAAGTGLDSDGCVDLNDPTDLFAGCDTADITVDSNWLEDGSGTPSVKYALFGVNQIRINLKATLSKDQTVSKKLQTSVKVANPFIRLGDG